MIRATLKQKLAQNQAQTQVLEVQMQALADASKNDPDAPNKARMLALEAKRSVAHSELSKVKQGLVAPDKMTQLLRDLVGRNPRLNLVGIKTLAVSPLTQAGKPEPGKIETAKAEVKAKEAPASSELGLYKHGVEISIEGSYADLVAYLVELEQLPWRVYWGDATLATQTYPVSRLTLTVYTLSLDKAWLSV